MGRKNPTVVMHKRRRGQKPWTSSRAAASASPARRVRRPPRRSSTDVYEEFRRRWSTTSGASRSVRARGLRHGSHISESELGSTLDYVEIGQQRARRSGPAGTASQSDSYDDRCPSSNRPSSPTSRTICASRRRRSSGRCRHHPVSGFEDAEAGQHVGTDSRQGLVTGDLTEAHGVREPRRSRHREDQQRRRPGWNSTSRSGVQGLLERDLPGAGRRGPGLLLDQPHGLHELTDLQSAGACTQPPSVARSKQRSRMQSADLTRPLAVERISPTLIRRERDDDCPGTRRLPRPPGRA